MQAIPLKATTLTPFAYHSLAIQSGTATLPELISDTAISFGLAASLGMMAARVALPRRDYLRDLRAMPYRSAVFTTAHPELLAPLVRRLNLDAEAGLQKKVQDVAYKGNLKEFFQIQEVPEGQVFHGALFGLDPFQHTGEAELIIRIGLHRYGMVRLEPAPEVTAVRLNAATAHLFARTLPVERYALYNLQLTETKFLDEAAAEVAQWT